MIFRYAELIGEIINRRLAIEILIPPDGLVPRGGIEICPQRGLLRIKAARFFYQREEAIMRYVFRSLSRSQHSICKSKNRIAIAFVQDLKSCRLAVRCLLQQPF